MSVEQRSELAALLGRHGALTSAIAMRADLCQPWQRQHIGPGEALARLAAWCERAERAGVPALQAFAARLRTYG